MLCSIYNLSNNLYAGGQNVTIDKSKLSLGSHNLTVTVITEGGQTAISEFVFESNDYLKLVCINYFGLWSNP